MIDKLKKLALLKAADILESGGSTLIGLADTARFVATGEVWDGPLPCNCPACQLKRSLGIDRDGPVLAHISFNPGELLDKAIREAGGDPDGPLFDFSPLGGKPGRGEA